MDIKTKIIVFLNLLCFIQTAIEKILSVYGQNTYPYLIKESTPIVIGWIKNYGLINAHLITLIINCVPLIALILFYLLSEKLFSSFPKHKKLCFLVIITVYLYLFLVASHTTINNIQNIQYAATVYNHIPF